MIGKVGHLNQKRLDSQRTSIPVQPPRVDVLTNEGHVDGDQQDNRFREKDTEGSSEVLAQQLLDVDLDLLLLGVNAPVAR